MTRLPIAAIMCLVLITPTRSEDELPRFKDLFNGKDLTGWVNVNTAADTWRDKDGMIICSGNPHGVMRTEKVLDSFVLHVEWMHMKPGGNSGVFAWSSATPAREKQFPTG